MDVRRRGFDLQHGAQRGHCHQFPTACVKKE
jgi:hypothetical protein